VFREYRSDLGSFLFRTLYPRTVDFFLNFSNSVVCVKFGPNSEVTLYRIGIWSEFKLLNCENEFGPDYIVLTIMLG
jgi:hypothetical protein